MSDHNRRLYSPLDLSAHRTQWPRQPARKNGCALPQQFYKTLPETPEAGVVWPRRRDVAGPASVKHLYTDIPHYYPNQIRYTPEGTMYEHDLTTRDIGPRRFSFHYKAYPFTHRYAREVNSYLEWGPGAGADPGAPGAPDGKEGKIVMMPYPDVRRWSKPVVVTDAARWGGWGSTAH